MPIALVLVSLAWLLVSGMVIVLCLAARRGDAAMAAPIGSTRSACTQAVRRRRAAPVRERARR